MAWNPDTWTLIDWQKIFKDEAVDRTAVLVTAQQAYFLQDIDLAGNFEQYGEVETSRYERHNGYHYVIIEFKDTASATNLLAKRSIVICDVDFVIKSFHSIDDLIESIQHTQVTHPSYPRASEKPDENILHILNDDCLSEIFRRIYSLFDIVAIENVCTRFKRVAEWAFIPLLKRKQIDFTELRAGENVTTLKDIEIFLRRHGSSIVVVQLCEDTFRNVADVVNPIFRLLQKHCPNLRSLTLYKDFKFKKFEDQTLIDIRPLLSKLNHVEIWDQSQIQYEIVPIRTYIEFISACTNVETLIVNINRSDPFPEIKYPKLKVFHTNSIYAELDGFLAQNHQIEILHIPFKPGRPCFIAENMPQIRELFFNHFNSALKQADSVHLNSLKQANISMKRLGIRRSVRAIFEIANITSIQLKVYDFMDYDILLELAKRLTNLKNLEFLYCMDSTGQNWSKDMLKEMLQHANKLTKLRFSWPSNYTSDYSDGDYNELLQVVQNRIHPLKLNIVLDSSTDCCDGEHGIKTIRLNADSQWLTITKRYSYLTRRKGDAYEKFQRQAEKADRSTHRLLSTLPSYGFDTTKQSKIKFNVL